MPLWMLEKSLLTGELGWMHADLQQRVNADYADGQFYKNAPISTDTKLKNSTTFIESVVWTHSDVQTNSANRQGTVTQIESLTGRDKLHMHVLADRLRRIYACAYAYMDIFSLIEHDHAVIEKYLGAIETIFRVRDSVSVLHHGSVGSRFL
jgi:hypothetical protein